MDHRGGYRGSDLDLRTARTWSATSTDLMSGFEMPAGSQQGAQGHRTSPIWVDETVLAAANQAFELAAAHGAREVQLEHLLNALTRIEPAVATLEMRGARVVPLRRESAILIASDIPVGLPAQGASPRRSHELEETLRLAAAHAAQGGRPAGVDDILHVLVDLRSDHPVGELLLRHLPRATRDFWSPLGSGRMPYGGPAHLVDVSESERLRASPGTAYLASGQPRLTERAPDVMERLAGLERNLAERFSALEAALTSAPGGVPHDLQPIKDRLDLIEEAVLSREGDGAIVERLAALARQLQEERVERTNALAALAADVKALAGDLGSRGSDGEMQGPVAERLQGLVADLERHRIELGASLGDRIAALESTLAAQGEKAAGAHTTYSEELAEVHEALMKLNVNQHTLAGSLEEWRSNEAGEIHLINARIGAVQEDGVRRLHILEQLSQDVELMRRPPPIVPQKIETPRRSSTFSQWLFGTEDWIKASWEKHVKRKA
jgi:hypothetical protein